ncbi:MAG: hypothetical protein V8Q57_04135, partial [Blautia sp.]
PDYEFVHVMGFFLHKLFLWQHRASYCYSLKTIKGHRIECYLVYFPNWKKTFIAFFCPSFMCFLWSLIRTIAPVAITGISL